MSRVVRIGRVNARSLCADDLLSGAAVELYKLLLDNAAALESFNYAWATCLRHHLPRDGKPPPLRAGMATTVRPRARARATLLRRGKVGATPKAHWPARPSMLRALSAQLLKGRDLPWLGGMKATWRAVVALAGPLVAQQTLNDGPGLRHRKHERMAYVCKGDVSEQVLRARRCAEKRARAMFAALRAPLADRVVFDL